MSNAPAMPTDSDSAPGDTGSPQAAGAVAPRWRDAWQAPVAAVSAAAIIGAVAYAVRTAPKPDYSAPIQEAAHQIEASKYGDALAILNTQIVPVIAKGGLSDELRREFHTLRGRALFLGQEQAGIDREENNRNIVTEYEAAEAMHAELPASDRTFLARAFLSLGEKERTLKIAESLEGEAKSAQRDLYKRLIMNAASGEGAPDDRLALELLTRLTADPELPGPDRLWSLRRQAELLIRQGLADDAITKIVRTLPRIESTGGPPLGEVLVTLAEAYLAADQVGRAGEQLGRASDLLGEGHELAPRVAMLRGVVAQRSGGAELVHAKEWFSKVVDEYSFSDDLPAALLGLSEVESLLANTEASEAIQGALEHYTRLTELMRSGPHAGVTVPQITQSLLARFREQFDKTQYDLAQRFAELAERLNGDKPPPEVFQALAMTHREAAAALLGKSSTGEMTLVSEADPATQREAKEHLIKAGEYFRLHASAVVQTDANAYSTSLWAAADAFDRAGDLEGSIGAFRQFQTDFPSDPRQPEAAFRLAEAYRARGDLELAEKLYRELIAGRESAGPSGPFADASYVPLAKTLLLDAKPENDKDAEGLLLTVVRGEVGGTAAPTFRDALRELGRYYYQSAQYERAIERLDECLERADPQKPLPPSESLGDLYQLADSYRLSAGAIAASLTAAMPDAQRIELEQTRRDRLNHAMQLFEQARVGLERLTRRTAADDVRLRNAAFYQADCAFDLRDFDTAIRLYDAARDRFPKEPASLVAMVQIVAALLEQGKTAEAATANARAKRFYESLPEGVWDDPTLPMTRKQWETWLDAQARIVGNLAGAKE